MRAPPPGGIPVLYTVLLETDPACIHLQSRTKVHPSSHSSVGSFIVYDCMICIGVPLYHICVMDKDFLPYRGWSQNVVWTDK